MDTRASVLLPGWLIHFERMAGGSFPSQGPMLSLLHPGRGKWLDVVMVVAAAALACGGKQSHFDLRLASSASSNGPDALPVISMQTGETQFVQFMLAGEVPADVTYSADGLPGFATLSGPLLTLAPKRARLW